jgi:protein-histidine pros-kinase
MRLLTKFSLVYAVLFGIGIAATGWVFRGQLQRNAREQVLYQAQVMMETALAMRNYTTDQVRPTIDDLQKPAAVTGGGDPLKEFCVAAPRKKVFKPQTVPAFAATEMFGYLRRKYPDYQYKEASLNPTNPRNRATEWEEDILKVFRSRSDLALVDGERMTPFGQSLYLARPLRAGQSCLECHTTPQAAPAELVALYGPSNGFGWRENEVIAAQIVSVPVALPMGMAQRSFRNLLLSLLIVAGVTLVLLDTALYLIVIRPVARLARTADEIGQAFDPGGAPTRGKDEVATLAAALERVRQVSGVRPG